MCITIEGFHTVFAAKSTKIIHFMNPISLCN